MSFGWPEPLIWNDTLYLQSSVLSPHVFRHSFIFPHVAKAQTPNVCRSRSCAFLKWSIYISICCVCLCLWPYWPVLQAHSHQLCCVSGSRGWNKRVHLARIPLLHHLLPEGTTGLSGGFCFSKQFVLIFPSSALTQGVKAAVTAIIAVVSEAASVAWNFSLLLGFCKDMGAGCQSHRSWVWWLWFNVSWAHTTGVFQQSEKKSGLGPWSVRIFGTDYLVMWGVY